MPTRNDFQKEWPKIKGQLKKMSTDALVLAKRGEKEFREFSKQGKFYLDSTALNLKKEHLYYLIGKEYVNAKCPGIHSAQMRKLLEELDGLDRDSRAIQKQRRAR